MYTRRRLKDIIYGTATVEVELEEQLDIDNAVEQLPEIQREFIGCILLGYSVNEAAKLLKLTISPYELSDRIVDNILEQLNNGVVVGD